MSKIAGQSPSLFVSCLIVLDRQCICLLSVTQFMVKLFFTCSRLHTCWTGCMCSPNGSCTALLFWSRSSYEPGHVLIRAWSAESLQLLLGLPPAVHVCCCQAGFSKPSGISFSSIAGFVLVAMRRTCSSASAAQYGYCCYFGVEARLGLAAPSHGPSACMSG